jgi:tetratricopeptide (TPR) repeat protein
MLRRLFGMRSAQEEFERGTAAAQAGRMAEGITALRRALELRPISPRRPTTWARPTATPATDDAALCRYRRAAELVPKFADVHVDIASILRERRELEEAERSLRAALALKPTFRRRCSSSATCTRAAATGARRWRLSGAPRRSPRPSGARAGRRRCRRSR